MKITVVGAGAMGGSYGGLLALAGHEVCLIDAWHAHVDAINRDGLRVDGVRGDHRVRAAASSGPIGGGADIVIVLVDANNTAAAAETARHVLAPDGFAITFQNGIGNVEQLQAALGWDRVLGGSSMCSAASMGERVDHEANQLNQRATWSVMQFGLGSEGPEFSRCNRVHELNRRTTSTWPI